MTETIVITGAGKRIGRTLALSLAGQGHAIAVHYNRSTGEAEEVVGRIRKAGGRAAAIGADLADEDAVATLIARAAEAVGPITTLINNASLFEQDDVWTATRDSWDAHMSVNLRAPFVLTQALAKALPKGANGNVVNIIDHRVWKLNPLFATYTLSKAGLWTLTRTLAQALAPRIRVNGIGPGPVLASIHQTSRTFAAEADTVPLGHGPTPEEIAHAVRFILATPSMTGQMIALDGGQHLAWQTPDLAVSE